MFNRAPPVSARTKQHLAQIRSLLQELDEGSSSDVVLPQVTREMDELEAEFATPEDQGIIRPLVVGLVAREVVRWIIRELGHTCNCIRTLVQRRSHRCLPLVRPSGVFAMPAA
jgi:hypothetical protein